MYRGAIIGVGKIAQTGHLPAFGDERLSDRVRIVAGVDTDPASRRLAHERFPDLRLYSNMEEMLGKEDIDFVDICATPIVHPRLIEIAAVRGKHILCEKPLAVSLEESERLMALLCRQSPAIHFMPCHQYRYSGLWTEMRSFIASLPADSGMFLQFNVFRTGADPGLLPGEGIWRVDQKLSGGGILADTGIHYLYLVLWMLGRPRAVTARTHHLALREAQVEDTAAILLEYDSRLVEITLTWNADRRTNSACVLSPHGSLLYDGKFLHRTKGEMNEVVPVPDASDKSHYVQLYVSLFGDFIELLESGKSHGPDIDEASESMRLLDACYASARSGTRVLLGNPT